MAKSSKHPSGAVQASPALGGPALGATYESSVQRARARSLKAVELVRSGLTFQQAAERLGMTRSGVAGACYRAGVRVGHWTSMGVGRRRAVPQAQATTIACGCTNERENGDAVC